MSTPRKVYALLTPAQRRSALWLLTLMLVGMVLETLSVGLVVPLLALLMQGDIAAKYPVLQPVLARLGNPSHIQLVTGGMLGLVFMYLVKNLFLAYSAWWQNRFAFGVHVHLSRRLFAIYLRQPYTFHLQRNSAELIRNVTGEVSGFQSTLLAIISLVTEGLALVGVTALLLWIEPVGAVIVVVVLSTAAFVFHRITRHYILRWGELRLYHAGLSTQHVMQGLGGAKDVKLLGRERDFLAQYGIHLTQGALVTRYQNTLVALPRMWLELLGVAGLATLVLTMLARGRDMAAVVPTLGLFAAAAFRLMPAVNRILSSVQGLRYLVPSINTLYHEFQLAAPDPAKRGGTVAPDFQRDIQLFNIAYTYPGAAGPSLAGLTLTIKKGELVGFIGQTGAGKSTLVDIVLGLLVPTVGQVCVDGRDIQQHLRCWQDQIGYVPQSIYLTDDTLRRNVAFGLSNEEIDDAAVQRAVEAAQLHEYIDSLPDGLETVVGERGIRLSGGERQRIGIARALYHDPAVLVLDEATSSLDNATERGVMQAVTALKGHKTILIVAHRLSTVEHCDRLYRLVQGRVAEEGSTDAVLRPNTLAIRAQA